MTKRYDEPIDVISESSPEEAPAPVSFSWRGRPYDVDQRLGSWREAGEWWNGSTAREREYHRVLARPAGVLSSGDLDAEGSLRSSSAVYDLYRDRLRGGWRLARLWD